MSRPDQFIINALHHISNNCPFLNDLMAFMANNDFLSSGILVSVLWFFWFQQTPNQIEKREKILKTLISCCLAIALGRLLTNILPFTTRPVLNAKLSSMYPFRRIADSLIFDNSMPSDHAVLYLALVTGVFFISKRAGILAAIYIFFVGLLPRVYLGLHYPVDIFIGGLVGISISIIYFNLPINEYVNRRITSFSTKNPGLFFVLFFLLTCQIGTMFDSTRNLQHFIITQLKNFF